MRFLESQRIVQSARDQIGKRAEKQYFFFREVDILRGFNVEHSMQLLRKKDRQANRRRRVRHHRFQRGVARLSRMERSHIPVSRHISYEPRPQRNALPKGSAALSGFRLNYEFARRIFEHGNSDVVVS